MLLTQKKSEGEDFAVVTNVATGSLGADEPMIGSVKPPVSRVGVTKVTVP